MLIGAHVSVAGGYLKALDYAESVGAECIQIFAKSPRQWRGPSVDPAAAESFVAARRHRGFGPVFTHTAYLINLATDDAELRAKSIPALADELVRGAMLGAAGVVCHVGNDPLGDPEAAAKRVAASVVEAFELAGPAGDGARLLLENTAGAGRTFGSTFEELGASIGQTGLPAERLGVCIDTCHAFAFGMASGLVVGPCTAPVLGALLLYVGARHNLLFGTSLLFTFALGMGTLLLAVGALSGYLAGLPRPGAWLGRVKLLFGGMLLVAAEYLFVKAGILFV